MDLSLHWTSSWLLQLNMPTKNYNRLSEDKAVKVAVDEEVNLEYQMKNGRAKKPKKTAVTSHFH